jgi:hypothetical protein
MDNLIFSIFPILLSVVPVALLLVAAYFTYKWVNAALVLKKEQNDLLRDILDKMRKE